MKRRDRHRVVPPAALVVTVLVWAASAVSYTTISAARPDAPAQIATSTTAAPQTPQAVFQRYCLTCHNRAMKRRGAVPVALDPLDLSNLGRDAETWEKVVRKVRTGLMPPPGRPRPDAATHDGFAAWLEAGARLVAPAANPGRTEPFHRLNRDRVPERHPRSAPPGRERRVAAAVRRRQLRIRQYRRRAEDVADVDGALPRGGAEDQPARRSARRPVVAQRRLLPPRRRSPAGRSSRGPAGRHAGRHRRSGTRSRPTANTRSASGWRAI